MKSSIEDRKAVMAYSFKLEPLRGRSEVVVAVDHHQEPEIQMEQLDAEICLQLLR